MRTNTCLIFLSLLLFTSLISAAPQIPSPEETFGFRMGEDKKLIDWEQIHSYFKKVDELSDRVLMQELGKTTLGKPFLLAIISSEQNLKNMGRLQSIQQSIAKPFTLKPDAASASIAEGKTVVLITLNIHSTEIASTQESVEVVYELATSDSPQFRKILDNVVVLLVPSLNPDGQQLVVDWYKKTLGTPAEGTAPPELYHYYAGHDNNRDWFMYNLAESRHTAKVLYEQWFPEIVFDQHQMGRGGARLFLPPYSDPVNPNVPPMLSAQVNLLGKFMVADLHRQEFKGVVTGTIFNAFFEGTMSKTPLWHNRIGILSEMASAYIATPVFYPEGSIGGMGRDLPENKTQTNFLDPWPGGWWRLRDIIDYEKAATYSLLDFAATFKEQIKTNFYNLNREAIENGQTEPPYGYVIPIDQHDPNAAVKLANTLRISGVEVRQINSESQVEQRKVPAGSFYISTAQPSRAYIKDLMETQKYPHLLEYPGGPPREPYDVTAWTLPMQFGAEVIALKQAVTIDSTPIQEALITTSVEPVQDFYLIERRYTNSYGMAHSLLKQKVAVFETTQAATSPTLIPAGTFVVPAQKIDRSVFEKLSQEWQVPVRSMASTTKIPMKEIFAARIGIYQSYMSVEDEGWTRYVLDQFKIEHKALHNADFKKKDVNLRTSFDVIIIPDMSVKMIVEGKEEQDDAKEDKEEEPIIGIPQFPKEYQGGIGKEGIAALKEFVRKGGTLITFAEASNFAIEKLRLPATNILKKVSEKEFYAPGSIFEAQIDTSNPLAYGLQDNAFIYFTNNPAFQLMPYVKQSKIIASYGDESPLRSGYLNGEQRLHGHVAMAEIPVENGRVILYGFRVQHRAQTIGTFKLLLNALFI